MDSPPPCPSLHITPPLSTTAPSATSTAQPWKSKSPRSTEDPYAPGGPCSLFCNRSTQPPCGPDTHRHHRKASQWLRWPCQTATKHIHVSRLFSSSSSSSSSSTTRTWLARLSTRCSCIKKPAISHRICPGHGDRSTDAGPSSIFIPDPSQATVSLRVCCFRSMPWSMQRSGCQNVGMVRGIPHRCGLYATSHQDQATSKWAMIDPNVFGIRHLS